MRCLFADLDVIIENVDGKNYSKKRNYSSQNFKSNFFCRRAQLIVDSGFSVCNDEINTIIRLANFNPLFERELKPHRINLN